jgi:hypothetical protein
VFRRDTAIKEKAKVLVIPAEFTDFVPRLVVLGGLVQKYKEGNKDYFFFFKIRMRN